MLGICCLLPGLSGRVRVACGQKEVATGVREEEVTARKRQQASERKHTETARVISFIKHMYSTL